jgi:hypothetical protein
MSFISCELSVEAPENISLYCAGSILVWFLGLIFMPINSDCRPEDGQMIRLWFEESYI